MASKIVPVVLDKLFTWRDSPLLFVRECLNAVPSDQQVEGLMEITKTRRMTIRSGHGTGKDAFAAWIILWFMSTRPYAKVACTAPTARQLTDILWSELAKWFRQSQLQNEFVHQTDKFFHKSAPKEWWARTISPQVKGSKEEQAETLAGLHGDHLLIIVDEASGVPDPVFIPLEGAMTQEDNRTLVIGNMTKNFGYFYESHFDDRIAKNWKRLHWDSRKSSLVSDKMVDYFRVKYGEESNVFRIRVAGEPPLEDEATYIPLHWARSCLGNEVIVPESEPLYLSVDVARYGDDYSVVLPRRGLQITAWDKFQGMNTINLAGFVHGLYRDLSAEGLAIDEIGVGAGVVDWFYNHNRRMLTSEEAIRCFGINVASEAPNKSKYHRLRDELWGRVKEKCMKSLYSFPDTEAGEELCNELSQPRYFYDNNGAVQIESKRDMKLRGVSSPNIADALCLSEHFESMAPQAFKRPTAKKKDSSLLNSRYGWMAV